MLKMLIFDKFRWHLEALYIAFHIIYIIIIIIIRGYT